MSKFGTEVVRVFSLLGNIVHLSTHVASQATTSVVLDFCYSWLSEIEVK